MKTIPFRLAALILTGLACHLLAPDTHAAGQARAEYRNVSSAQAATQQKNPGVASFNGYIKGTQTQTANIVVLQDCAFGQAFSQWYPSDTYAAPIAASVRTALYPVVTPTTTRSGIEGSGKAFRYKWLLYNGTGTDVTAVNATNFASWFTDADRNVITQQIASLKVAVAASPLDTGLRDLLLDIYYDLAVAEMQAAKPKLATLARYHLGIEVISPASTNFIIDKEIDTYAEIDTAYQSAVDQYAALLSTPFPDIDPSSFDSRVPFGIPMGQYIFRREQPRRSSTPTAYANDTGTAEVPQVVNGVISTPGTLFDNYKDLKALLDIVAQRMQNAATLARLRGTRQAGGDVALARQTLAQAACSLNNDLQIIKSWFPELFPPNLNALTPDQTTAYKLLQQQSGVLASLAGIETAALDLSSVTPFLNGSANVLGYDPDFLLLVQDTENPAQPRESYDVLRAMLTANANAPLTVALSKLGAELPPTGAIGTYLNFQEKAEKVADDIDNADTALADRYFAITGFEPDASPGFNKQFPIPTAGSELGAVLTEIAGLQEQSDLRTSLTANFDDLVKTNADATKAGFAQQSVTLAQDKENVINNAVSTYKDKAGKLYDSTTAMKTIAAASQATMDATSAAAGCDNPIAGGTALAVGAVNIAIQTATTAVIADNDKNIDFAGVDLSATTSKADIALTVNQSRLDLESLKRNIIANNMAAKSDKSALMQALAHKAALLAELDRIEKKRDSTVAAIRKKSYADPMNYYRAEAALIDADESFATAQRWMFYTLQALNYKWNGKFAIVQGSKRYDTSTLFKSRNAMELNDLLTQMDEWDNIRKAQTINSARIYTRISLLEHILARNPQRFSLTDSSDPGTRVDTTSATTPRPALYTLDFFRRLLTAKYTEAGSGDLVIPFSTVFPNQAPDRVDGFFFRGATYDTAGTIIDQGFWREKIEYVKVNIVASNAPATPSAYGGALTYGGTTYFHTRVPPRSDRTVAGLAIDDAPGELLVAPFRFWQSPDFSLNGFQASSQQVVPIGVAYARDSAFVSGTTPDNLSSSFQVNDFVGRSIATTGWILRIYRSQVNGIVVNADNISDIEILVAYKHSTRVFPPN